MSKQTRLNFGQASSSAPAKRRRLNSSEKANDDDETEKSSTSSSKAKSTDEEESTGPETANESVAKTHTPTPQTQQPLSNQYTIALTHHRSDLFTAPPYTLLCHATNAQGTWGAGIAAAFKKNYPAAFKLYASHCAAWSTSSLLGTTFLIPPQEKSSSKAEREAKHWIGCLFTSEKKGKGKGSKESILEATGEAVQDLVRRVKDVNEDVAAGTSSSSSATTTGGSKGGSRPAIASIRMCKINSGLFGVPWEATSAVVEGIEIEEGDLKEIELFSLD